MYINVGMLFIFTRLKALSITQSTPRGGGLPSAPNFHEKRRNGSLEKRKIDLQKRISFS